MLKIKKVDLNEGLEFLPGELEKLAGDAAVKLATAADSADTIAKGVFHMSNSGTGVMCSIQAAGKLASGYELSDPSNMFVELTGGKLVREYNVAASSGTSTVDTGLGANLTAVNSLTDGVTATLTSYGVFTVPAASVDRKIKVELTINVGKCDVSDDNVSHKLDLVPNNVNGLIEFTALCNVMNGIGLRPNKVSMLIRGSNPWKSMGKDESIVTFDPSLEPADAEEFAEEIQDAVTHDVAGGDP